MQLTMPPTRPGALSQEEYTNIAAFILQSNGAPAGEQPLTPSDGRRHQHDRDRPGSGGGGAQPAGRGAPPAAAQAAAGGRGRGAGATGRHHGRRRSEELRPGHRRDAAQSGSRRLADDPPRLPRVNYSPLNQITADNVKDLRLQWIWAMNEGGANQPAPLVHNGVIYPQQPRQHAAGDRRQDRRADLGESLRHATRTAPPCAASPSTTTRSSWRRATRTWWRSTRGPARPSGRRPSAIARRATTAPAAARSSPRAS